MIQHLNALWHELGRAEMQLLTKLLLQIWHVGISLLIKVSIFLVTREIVKQTIVHLKLSFVAKKQIDLVLS